MVERFNRTLEHKIHGYLTFSYQSRYIVTLSDMVAAYDHTRHSFTGFAPVKVDRSNAEEVFFKLYKRGRYKEGAALFSKGDHV